MKYLWLMALICVSFTAHAKKESFKLDKSKKISVTVPNTWESAQDLYGIPFTLLGPWKNESRPVITVLSTFLTQQKFNQEDLKKILSDFKDQKSSWVLSHKGQLLSFEPLEEVEFKTKVKGYHIGAEFVVNNIHYIERSYYLDCENELFNLKYSIRKEHRSQLKDIQSIVESFQCE